MSRRTIHRPCPSCGEQVAFATYANPTPTVDVVLRAGEGGVVLIRRRNPPWGWALPGGFVDYGESVEQAARREVREEVGADVELDGLVGVYSHPERDPRKHTLSVVFTAEVGDYLGLLPGDDASEVRVFPLEDLPETAFDHGRILRDFLRHLQGGEGGLENGASRCQGAT
ncbi:MAG: NUDIX hydrolase [Desulfohalobiaceae bacterium]|nr:NUDIX hydrolase [Desulfohalobiaceae bacterium]